MPIATNWYDEQHRIITQKFEGRWTWEELGSELKVMATLADSVPYNLVLYTDMSETNAMPSGNILAQGRSGVTNVPDNITQIIIVIQSRLIEVFAGLVFEMVPKWRNRVKFVKTVKEGQKLLAEAIAANEARSNLG
jgi:hypothetical protein